MDISIEIKHEDDKGKVLVEVFHIDDTRIESFILKPQKSKIVSVIHGDYIKIKERD